MIRRITLERETLPATACCTLCFTWIEAGQVPEVWALYADGNPWCRVCDRCAEGGPEDIRRRLMSLREQYLDLAAGLADIEHAEVEIVAAPAVEPTGEDVRDTTVQVTQH